MLAYGGMVALGLVYARDPDRVMTNLIEFSAQFHHLYRSDQHVTTRRAGCAAPLALLAMGVILAATDASTSRSPAISATNSAGLAHIAVSGDQRGHRRGPPRRHSSATRTTTGKAC